MEQEINEPLSPILIPSDVESDPEVTLNEKEHKKKSFMKQHITKQSELKRELKEKVGSEPEKLDSESDSDFEKFFPKRKNIKRKRIESKPIHGYSENWITRARIRNPTGKKSKFIDLDPSKKQGSVSNTVDDFTQSSDEE